MFRPFRPAGKTAWHGWGHFTCFSPWFSCQWNCDAVDADDLPFFRYLKWSGRSGKVSSDSCSSWLDHKNGGLYYAVYAGSFSMLHHLSYHTKRDRENEVDDCRNFDSSFYWNVGLFSGQSFVESFYLTKRGMWYNLIYFIPEINCFSSIRTV